jgi:hypothetical protein
MEYYKDFTTWKECLKFIKQNSPNGLFERWNELDPLGVIDWDIGLELTDKTDNSSNWIDRDSNNIVYQAIFLNDFDDDEGIVGVAFHIEGDVRVNYTDYFLFKLEDIQHLLQGFENEDWISMGGDVE